MADAIAAARAYETLHVPALFGEWTDPVLDAARAARGQRVLDVACGTGVLARAALQRVGATGSVAAVDPAPGMLAVAREIEPSIEWTPGSAESLPFDAESFDAVVSQFGMMFFPDRQRAAGEMLRVLSGDGRVAIAVWDAIGNAPGFRIEADVVERIAGPRAAEPLRMPFRLGDRDELVALLEAAGARSVEAATRTGTARFPSVRALVDADLRGWLPVMDVHLSEATIATILEEAERELAGFVTADGSLVFDAPAHIVAGVRAD